MVRESPYSSPPVDSGVVAPPATMGNYGSEGMFARYRMDRYLRALARRDSDRAAAEAAV